MKTIEELKNYNVNELVAKLSTETEGYQAWEVISNDYEKISECKKFIINILSSKVFKIERESKYSGSRYTTITSNGFGLKSRDYLQGRNELKVIFPNDRVINFCSFLLADNYYKIDDFITSIKEIDDTHMTSSHHVIKEKIIKICDNYKKEIKPEIEKIKEEKKQLEHRIKSLEEDVKYLENKNREKYNVQHIATYSGNFLVRIENSEFINLFYLSPEGQILRDCSQDECGDEDSPQNEWDWALEEWDEAVIDGFPLLDLQKAQ